MTKKEIVRKIAERLNETQLKTKEIVQLTFDAIVDTLLTERRIELRNFGVFEVKLRRRRKARNPRTEDPVEVPEKFVVTFKPGKEMEEKVRELKPTAEDLERLKKPRPGKKPEAQAATPPPPPASIPAPTPPPVAPETNGASQPTPDAAPKKKRARKPAQA